MEAPHSFDLDLTVRSHGFYDLAPWSYDAARRTLARPLLLERGRAVRAEVAEAGPRSLALRVTAQGTLGARDAAAARSQVRTCLALDEDLAPFHARLDELARAPRRGGVPRLAWAVERGAGRLLRSPTVFEDAVKTLCTTNCTWALTRVMASKLVEALGAPAPGGGRAFPTPERMAERPEGFYRDVVRAGYRAPFLRALAVEVASGRLDLEAWRAPGHDTAELARRIRALPGFGPYATGHLLRLLGHHDQLALDSWTRGKLARLRGLGRIPSDRTIARWYAPYGRFAGLALWLEVTADWFGATPTWP